MLPLLATSYDGALQGYAWGLMLIVSVVASFIAFVLALFPRAAGFAHTVSKAAIWITGMVVVLFLLLMQAGYHDSRLGTVKKKAPPGFKRLST